MRKKIIIGSRESRLAVIQSRLVQEYIREKNPDMEVDLLTMKTTGDIILDRTLDQVGGKGLFVKELDRALMDGRSQLSVHSLKDMPAEIPEELPLIAFSKREDPRDVLVLPADAAEKGMTEPDLSLPIGCAGPRRQLQIKEIYPGCTVKPVRGNVLTRLEKLDRGEYGALILAAAGLKRLGLSHRITRYFEPEEMLPAAGQGILAVQGRKGEDYTCLKGFEDPDSAKAARAERAFVKALDGGCSSPIAAHGRIKEEVLELMGLYYNDVTGNWKKMMLSGPSDQPEALGNRLADMLKHAVDGSTLPEETEKQEKMEKMEKQEEMEEQKKKGKVWLVGAGPGDLGLFTLKGMEVLQTADVVVYDALVGPAILSCIPQQAETINVGKRASHHTMKQEEINRILADEAKKGKRVVRLKGGDPFLFGRGGEEVELLVEEGVDFEVVPGVTAAVSVPAYNGIPVTHRDFCSSIHIITGHKRAGKDYDMDFPALVRTKGTLVFLMGVTALPDICQGLLEGGMDPDTPAAILQQGTTAGQKRIVATVATLAEEVVKKGIETPAIIVVGKVCSLAEQFSWYEKLPLSGCRILVTRPKNRPSVMAQKLRRAGAEAIEIPSIKTEAKADQRQLTAALDRIDTYQWLVFTSPYGVEVFFREMRQQKRDVRILAGVKIAVIGPATAREVEKRGLLVDLMPEIYAGDALGRALRQACNDGDKVLLARAEIGSQDLTGALRGQGEQEEKQEYKFIEISDVAIYETNYVSQDAIDIEMLLDEGKISCVTFTSASTVKGFAAAAGGDLRQVKAACIGEQTRAAAEALGMKTFVSKEATMDSLTELIVTMRENDVI